MLTRKQLALVKLETTYGTDASPDGSNRVEVTELESQTYEGDRQARERYQQHLGGRAEVNTGPYATIQITVPLAGSGEVGVAPVYGPLLQSCKMEEIIEEVDEVPVRVLYRPISDDETAKSCTIYYIKDGRQQKITGAQGTWTLSAQRGQFPTLQFTMTGRYHRPTQIAPVTPSAVMQADELPVNNQNTEKFVVHGFNAVADSLTLELGNEVVFRNMIGDERTRITDRNPSGQLNIEAPDIPTKDYFAAAESHEGVTLGPVEFEHGKTAGNIVNIAGPKVQLSSISDQDSDGVVHYQFDTRWLPDVANDELVLTFK